ncbi:MULTISPECIES: hypothetical protein [unclassified Methylobacterium]|uniref:hypothetical protein n=1 Tax=unclassified Methylobacterium TaxID=2615210 RepID=UPI0011C1FE1B|nr:MULTISPECIES: hypothetical protein [unclassified Methylobacterium]QEE37595.1 hypothetical protein FVA80_00110 [Methylobacterium sp. WL1]TXN51323.1 hypothetical protein FV241_30205 [Methylobacterium sp. WL2]
MTTAWAKDAIRSQMKTMGMKEDDLVEGCRQIVAEHDAAQAAAAAEAEREHTRALADEVARQAEAAGDPRDRLMDNIKKGMLGGSRW